MAPGAPDFSVTVCFGPTPFGFVAYRHDTYLITGPEGYWLPVPSWLFALGIIALAWLEWRLVQWAWEFARRWWQRTRRPGAPV